MDKRILDKANQMLEMTKEGGEAFSCYDDCLEYYKDNPPKESLCEYVCGMSEGSYVSPQMCEGTDNQPWPLPTNDEEAMKWLERYFTEYYSHGELAGGTCAWFMSKRQPENVVWLLTLCGSCQWDS